MKKREIKIANWRAFCSNQKGELTSGTVIKSATYSANSAAARDKNLGLHLSSEEELRSILFTC